MQRELGSSPEKTFSRDIWSHCALDKVRSFLPALTGQLDGEASLMAPSKKVQELR
jgi:hypothetical protein